jgi:hypothetical protein
MQQAAQHPGDFFMLRHALGGKIRSRHISMLLGNPNSLKRRARCNGMICAKLAEHRIRRQLPGFLNDGRQPRKFRKTPRCLGPKRTHPFGQFIDRLGEFGILGRGRVAKPFGFALTGPGGRISRTRLIPMVTRIISVPAPKTE